MGLSHHKWLNGGRAAFNWPYGIDIDPIDGTIWYAKLLGNKIGTVNRETLEVTEYDTPHAGPRRMRFGPDGILWIPSFDEGKLMRSTRRRGGSTRSTCRCCPRVNTRCRMR